MPAVICSAWKANDNSIGIVFTNISEETLEFSWKHEKYSFSGKEMINGRDVLLIEKI